MSGPEVFRLPHLSEDAVAAFADGVLSANATARARKHCAECVECAAAVRGQREAVMMLRAAPPPSLPSGLLARLTGLPLALPAQRPRGGLPTGLGPDGSPVFITTPAGEPEQASSAPKRTAGENAGDKAGQNAGDEHKAASPPESTAGEHDFSGVRRPGPSTSWPHLSARSRRVALPLGTVATAAVVIAGTFGQSPATAQPSARPVVQPVSNAATTPSSTSVVELGVVRRP